MTDYSTPQRFRKRPVVIEAIRYDGTFPLDWLGDNALVHASPDHDGGLVIKTLEGEMTARIGDWIIKGVQRRSAAWLAAQPLPPLQARLQPALPGWQPLGR